MIGIKTLANRNTLQTVTNPIGLREDEYMSGGQVFWVEALREHGVLVTAPFHGSSEYSFLLHWDIAG